MDIFAWWPNISKFCTVTVIGSQKTSYSQETLKNICIGTCRLIKKNILEKILLAKYKVNRSTYLANYMHSKAKVNGMFSHMTPKWWELMKLSSVTSHLLRTIYSIWSGCLFVGLLNENKIYRTLYAWEKSGSVNFNFNKCVSHLLMWSAVKSYRYLIINSCVQKCSLYMYIFSSFIIKIYNPVSMYFILRWYYMYLANLRITLIFFTKLNIIKTHDKTNSQTAANHHNYMNCEW